MVLAHRLRTDFLFYPRFILCLHITLKLEFRQELFYEDVGDRVNHPASLFHILTIKIYDVNNKILIFSLDFRQMLD